MTDEPLSSVAGKLRAAVQADADPPPPSTLRSAPPIRDPRAFAAASLEARAADRQRREDNARQTYATIAALALGAVVATDIVVHLYPWWPLLAVKLLAVGLLAATVAAMWREHRRQVDKRLRALELRQRTREGSDRG